MNLKNYVAQTATQAYRIAAHGSEDGRVKQANTATDAFVGVFEELDHAAGERVDVVRYGPALVTYGGVVPRGAPLTSNATGQAVVANPAAGSNVRIIGFADIAGVDGDIVEMCISPQSYQG